MATIRLKNSVVENKKPTAAQLELGELAVNAHFNSPAVYFRDNNNVVHEILPGGGGGSDVGTGPLPGTGNEIGDLHWDGDLLYVWNGSSWEVVGGVTSVNGETGAVVLDLGDLNDVNLGVGGPSNGDIIAWNGSAWVSTAAPPADISGSSIGDLNDVDVTGVDDGDILIWNAGAGEWQATNRGTVPENTSDLVNDGENGTDPFITEALVNNILAGNNPDGSPNPGAAQYLQEGDNVSLLNNDAGYITDAGVTKIVAGTNITLDPAGGTGEVTINAADAAALALDDLTDVDVPAPSGGDILAYNGSEWVAAAAPPADISGSSINQLNDVNAGNANNGDMLIWQTDNWVNTPAPTATSDFQNDGEGTGSPFITEAGVSNILNGNLPDGTPNPGAEAYLKAGDDITLLNNNAVYLKTTETAADSNKLGGQDPSYYLNYQNLNNTPTIGNGALTIKLFGQATATQVGTFTANQDSGTTITLPQIDYAQLLNKPTIPTVGNGAINVNAGNGLTASGEQATANQSTPTTRTLTAVADPGKGLTVTATGIGIAGSWANIPEL